jgi:KipI family sensor histidine kinase inhibitor
MSVRPFGDAALLVELEQRIDPAIVDRARGIADAWEARGHGPAVPAYASVVLRFDPERLDHAAAAREAAALLDAPAAAPHAPGRRIEIPTTYDGPDLADVAARSGLHVDELVALHSGTEYRAFFLGFMPGLAYCGLLDPRIVAPRLATPRARVPAGSVAVANGQTVVYPFDSPGGWRLIGRTAVALFDPAADPPARIAPGDRVRFVPR